MGDVERCHISRLYFLCWVFGRALVGGRNITVLWTVVVDWRRVTSPSFRAFASFYSSGEMQTSEIICAPLNSPSISALKIGKFEPTRAWPDYFAIYFLSQSCQDLLASRRLIGHACRQLVFSVAYGVDVLGREAILTSF